MCVVAKLGTTWLTRNLETAEVIDENDIGPIVQIGERTVQMHKNGHVNLEADDNPHLDDLMVQKVG